MKLTAQARSYDGAIVYVGIDVHKRTYSVVARVNQVEVKRWTTSANPKQVAKQLLKYFEGAKIHTVYEAGFSGFVLHRILEGHGINSMVVQAANVEVVANRRVKTDKRDARKLSEQLETGRLKGIRVPTEVEEQTRLLSRTRRQLVSQRTQIQNQIRMKAHQFGLIEAEDKRQMSHRWVEELLEKNESAAFALAVKGLSNVWHTLDREIATLEGQLKAQAEEDPNETIYRSVPGVGFISARVLSNELGNLCHFANERELFSYIGLTPSEYSSGDSTRRGGITKQGNTQVRAVLIEVAWRAIQQDASLERFYQRIKLRSGGNRAIVAVARKLMGRIRAAFRYQQPYRLEPLTESTAPNSYEPTPAPTPDIATAS